MVVKNKKSKCKVAKPNSANRSVKRKAKKGNRTGSKKNTLKVAGGGTHSQLLKTLPLTIPLPALRSTQHGRNSRHGRSTQRGRSIPLSPPSVKRPMRSNSSLKRGESLVQLSSKAAARAPPRASPITLSKASQIAARLKRTSPALMVRPGPPNKPSYTGSTTLSNFIEEE